MKYIIMALIAFSLTPVFALEQGGEYLVEDQHETLIIFSLDDDKNIEIFLDGNETILKHAKISNDGDNGRFFGETMDGNKVFYIIYDLENDKFFTKIYDTNSLKVISTAERFLDVPTVTEII